MLVICRALIAGLLCVAVLPSCTSWKLRDFERADAWKSLWAVSGTREGAFEHLQSLRKLALHSGDDSLHQILSLVSSTMANPDTIWNIEEWTPGWARVQMQNVLSSLFITDSMIAFGRSGNIHGRFPVSEGGDQYQDLGVHLEKMKVLYDTWSERERILVLCAPGTGVEAVTRLVNVLGGLWFTDIRLRLLDPSLLSERPLLYNPLLHDPESLPPNLPDTVFTPTPERALALSTLKSVNWVGGIAAADDSRRKRMRRGLRVDSVKVITGSRTPKNVEYSVRVCCLGWAGYLYKRKLVEQPDLGGRMNITLQIDSEGRLAGKVLAESTVGDPAFEAAVLRLIAPNCFRMSEKQIQGGAAELACFLTFRP